MRLNLPIWLINRLVEHVVQALTRAPNPALLPSLPRQRLKAEAPLVVPNHRTLAALQVQRIVTFLHLPFVFEGESLREHQRLLALYAPEKF